MRPQTSPPRLHLTEVPPEIPEDAMGFMQQCLIKDPTLRPSAAELGHHHWLQSSGGIISQVDEDSMKSLVGPCTLSGSRRFGPKVKQFPAYVRGLRGDQADGVEVGCMEPANLRKDRGDSDMSTTMHAQQSPSSVATPSKTSHLTGFARLLKAH
eukprot:g13181.t1